MPNITDKTYKSCNHKYCKNVIRLRYLNDEHHLISRIESNAMLRLSTEYNELYDNQYENIMHKNIRFDSKMEEDIKREYTDILRQREYIKNENIIEKITESKRVDDLLSKCLDTMNMLDKRIRDARLKIDRAHAP